jgi:hypothetical protein
MPSPRPYHDEDPPPAGSPRLLGGSMGRLSRYRATAELRAAPRVPAEGVHLFHRNLMIALAVKAGMTHESVAKAMGLSRVRVTNILAELETLLPPDDPAA